jgi:hypothetical protein
MTPDKWRHDWDEKTRRLVLDRIRTVPTRAFFSAPDDPGHCSQNSSVY